MPQIATKLATSLNSRIATSLAGRGEVLLLFQNATFTNTTQRYLLDTLNKRVLGPFAAGTPATTTYQGRTYAQIEEARTNVLTRSQDLSHADWTKTRLETPTAQTDPLSGSTAWKLIPNTDNDQHRIAQLYTVDGSSAYCFYVIAKAAEYTWIRLTLAAAGFVGSPSSYFNLGSGAVGTNADCDSADILDLGNGWYLCSITATSDAAAEGGPTVWVADGDGSVNFAGNASDGVIVWNPQLEAGAHPSSPIKTVAAAATRNKDQLYWPAAVVPAAIDSGKWSAIVVPFWAHDEEAGNQYIAAKGANDYLRWNGTNDKFEVYDGGAQKVQSGALTMTRVDVVTETANGTAGTLKTEGAATGDSEETGTAWEWGSADLDWGQDSSDANQFNGLISEPYA